MDQRELFLKRQKKIRIIVVSLIVMFVLMIGGAIVMLPTLRKELKAWRSDTFLEEAREHLERGAGAQAIHSAVIAVQNNPDNVEAIRMAAQLLTQVPHVDAFVYWDKLLGRDERTENDLLEFVRFCLRLGHLELSRPHLQELLEKERPSVDAFTLGVQFWQIERDNKRTLDLVQTALTFYPDNSLFKILLSQLLLQTGSAKEIEQARETLWDLTDDAEMNVRLHAYNLLSKNFKLSDLEKQKMLSDSLFESGDTNSVLLGYDLSIRLEPERKQELIAQAVSQFFKADGEDELLVARWLNGQSAFVETLEMISREDALADQKKLMLYLDAIAGLDRWSDVQDLFFDEKLNLDPIVLRIFKTRVALALDDEHLAEAQWNHALSLAKNDPQKLLFIAEYFDKLGAWDYAWRAYEKVLDFPHHAMAVGRRMIMLAEIRKDTVGILEVLKKLTAKFPQEEVPKVDLAYVELLLNKNVEGAVYSLEVQLQSPVQTMALRTAAALGYIRTNQLDKALKLYDETPLNLSTALPAWKAIYAAVLSKSGEEKKARNVVAIIDIARLKPEEYELIKHLVEPYQFDDAA